MPADTAFFRPFSHISRASLSPRKLVLLRGKGGLCPLISLCSREYTGKRLPFQYYALYSEVKARDQLQFRFAVPGESFELPLFLQSYDRCSNPNPDKPEKYLNVA